MKPSPLPIAELASRLGLSSDEYEPYGRFKAKLALSLLDRSPHDPDAKYVVVTGITPTPLGEGKTTTTIGLAMALARLGQRAVACIRQPSLGPVFGIKGGATGAGRARVIPADEINLHLTGDSHAVSVAHNLLAACLDNHLYHGNRLGIDPASISWGRVTDVSDRALRSVRLSEGLKRTPRESFFQITDASEVMAILALAKNRKDLRERLGRIVVAFTANAKPVNAEDLRVAGAMGALLREACKPNLLQTLEGTPVLIHAGPFGNIAHGNSSVIADQIALGLANTVVTECGFGSDLGLEKLINIKCRAGGFEPRAGGTAAFETGLAPRVAVIVASVRALKMHGGNTRVAPAEPASRPGKPLDPALEREDLVSLAKGCENLARHIEIVRSFGLPAIVAVNRFPTDTAAELGLVEKFAREHGARDAVQSEVYSRGAEGGEKLARAVAEAARERSKIRYTYFPEDTLQQKIEKIATKVYGAIGVEYSPEALRKLALYTKAGFERLAVCMAKTHLSISHDPALKGSPRGFTLPVRDIQLSAGAGFVYPLAGDIRTLPGLPSHPNAERIDLDESGEIRGLV